MTGGETGEVYIVLYVCEWEWEWWMYIKVVGLYIYMYIVTIYTNNCLYSYILYIMHIYYTISVMIIHINVYNN